MALDEKLLEEVIAEVFVGYSKFIWDGKEVFFKHFGVGERSDMTEIFEKKKEGAIAKGLPTEADQVAMLKAEGQWTDQEDLSIATKEEEVKMLEKSLNKLPLESQKKAQKEKISELRTILWKLKDQKRSLIGKTAEEYASNVANDEFIRMLAFSDKELTRPLFAQDYFNEHITVRDLRKLTDFYVFMSRKMSDENLQKAALSDSFSLFLGFSEKPEAFFGKPLSQLSVYQLKILNYAKMFLSIFQNFSDIPDEMRKDPKALLGYGDSQKAKSKLISQKGEKGATAIFGTREDVKDISGGVTPVSLKDLIKKKGGALDMKDMMEMMGEKVN